MEEKKIQQQLNIVYVALKILTTNMFVKRSSFTKDLQKKSSKI
jgi:hypothetical protein